MSEVREIQFSRTIRAPVAVVYETMLDPEAYQVWTAAFAEGSYFEGSWEEGSRMRFLTPSGDGMVAEIAENRPNEFVSIRHLGYVMGGVEDTESEALSVWAPAFENYTFGSVPEGTELVIDQSVTAEFEPFMQEAWPRALEVLAELCEAEAAGARE